MSKPRLRLVHSSNGTEPVELRARSAFEQSPWETGLELIHLGLLVSCRNYVTLMQATVAVLELCTDPEKTVPRYLKSR